MSIFERIGSAWVGMVLPILLVVCGGFLTVYLRGFYLLHPIKTVRRMLAKEGGGTVSPFRALSVSLAGTLGVGNIVGVAVAVTLGGAGAVFWMWISALLSMILKYAEIVLAMRYRTERWGHICGGPMYYMKKGVDGKLGKGLAGVFSFLGIVSSFAMGDIVQMNAASEAAHATFRIPKLFFGIMIALVCAVVIFGGFRGISRVTAVVIPLASLLYLYLSIFAVICDGDRIPFVMREIFEGAFSGTAACGGVLGMLLSGAVRHGVAKGSFSHEAGCGTAPMAHAESDVKIAAKQGLLGIFEVFFDTIVMCTLTGLVLLLARDGDFITDNGMLLVIYSFSRYYGKSAAYLISGSILVFAFATVICWAHYGMTCLAYFTRSPRARAVYLSLYCAVCVVGAVIDERQAWTIADLAVALMTTINLSSVMMLCKDVREETEAAGLCRLPPFRKIDRGNDVAAP